LIVIEILKKKLFLEPKKPVENQNFLEKETAAENLSPVPSLKGIHLVA